MALRSFDLDSLVRLCAFPMFLDRMLVMKFSEILLHSLTLFAQILALVYLYLGLFK